MLSVKREDIRDWLVLRSRVANAWEVVRFRKKGRRGDVLEIQYLDEPPLYVRGETNDFHMFHRINLRDEYRLAGDSGWDCVVDLGGNVGLFAARAARMARRVVTYEPIADNFECLRRNCDSRPNVESVLCAVAGKAQRIRVYRPKNPTLSGVHSIYTEMGGHMSEGYDEVDAITLDQLFARHAIDHCDLVKIDVEGAEYEILHATSRETFGRIDRIHGEYHDVQPDDPRSRIGNFEGFLQSMGYTTEIVPHRREENHGMFFARRV